MSKQTTLMQSWGGTKGSKKPKASTSDDVIHIDEEDDDDLMLALALDESLREPQLSTSDEIEQSSKATAASSKQLSLFETVGQRHDGGPAPTDADFDLGFDDDLMGDGELLGMDEDMPLPQATNIEDLPGFDKAAGRLWIYPTNYPMRDYQYEIVNSALHKNTLVVLPTGLGKTFIAAVLMYNFYRWYPQGKVVFMAPTKPLVAQQIEACYNIMGIPQEHTAEMTGAMSPPERQLAWHARRVFFLTPQVLTNDLSRSACPAEEVKCLVVDEAHKALGNHAYCQVVRELVNYSQDFRVLALSATPGSDIKAVQNVINNLLISHVELRSEESPDIQRYSHERTVDKIVVPLGRELTQIKEKYIQIMSVIVDRLKRLGVLYCREVTAMSKFLVLKARDAFRQDPPQNLQRNQFGSIEGDFAIAMSLYHGYELLQLHGLRSLYHFLESTISGSKGYGRTRTELMKNAHFRDLMEFMSEKFSPNNAADSKAPKSCADSPTPFSSGHPKMDKLQEIVLLHFNKFKDAANNDGPETRIMIFSQYRDSVGEITEMLQRHQPLVKVMSFIGQSSANKASKGFTQKEQLRVMKVFREGGYNTLVSTCVGEEGLDIGEVDLIVCFDASKSPIRLVQRMGRTGRKRQGRIVMLVTEGKEEQIYNQSQYSKRSIHKALLNGSRSLRFYPQNPRMIPQGLDPRCHKMHITVENKFVAGATKGKAATTTSGNRSMVSYVRKGSAAGAGGVKRSTSGSRKDGLLTDAQLQYWTHHYKVDEKEVPLIPETKMLSLKTDKGLTPTHNDASILSLSEWLPWQNRLHTSHVAGHSTTSEDMVALVEFIELQNVIGCEEDNYGQEMRTYLNEEDIIKPDAVKGIRRFCTPVADHNKVRTRQHVAKVKRRSETLPTFSSDEGEKDSDDDLPPAFENKSLPVNRSKVSSPSSTTNCLQSKALSKDSSPSIDTSVITNRQPKKGTKKKQAKTADILENSSKTIFKKGAKVKNKRKKFRKSSECADTTGFISVIEPAVDEEDDFDIGKGERASTSFGSCNKDDTSPINPPMDIAEDPTFELIMGPEIEEEIAEPTGEHHENVEDVEDVAGVKEDSTLSQMFPVFTPQQIFPTELKVSESTQRSKVTLRSGRVLTPPDEEETDSQLEELDEKGKLSPVDILDVIEAWKSNDTKVKNECPSAIRVNSTPKMSVSADTVVLTGKSDINRSLELGSSLDFMFVDEAMKSQVHKKSLFKNVSTAANALNKIENSDLSCIEESKDTSVCERVVSDASSTSMKDSSINSKSNKTEEISALLTPVKTISPKPNRSIENEFVKASSLQNVDSNSSNGELSPVLLVQAYDQSTPNCMAKKSKISVDKRNNSLDEVSSGHDSFFNDEDEALFQDFKTPHCSADMKRQNKVRRNSKASQSSVDNALKTPSSISSKSSEHSFKTPSPVPTADASLLTFTQAMACINTSLDHNRLATRMEVTGELSSKIGASPELAIPVPESSDEDSPVFSSNICSTQPMFERRASVEADRIKVPNFDLDDGGDDEKVHVDEENKNEIKEDLPQTENTQSDPDGVQFDLGFDLGDDFDDDDAVPPSPPLALTQTFTQKSKLAFDETGVVKSQSPGLIGGLFGAGNKDDVKCVQESDDNDDDENTMDVNAGNMESDSSPYQLKQNESNQAHERESPKILKEKHNSIDADETLDPFGNEESFWDAGIDEKLKEVESEEESQSLLPQSQLKRNIKPSSSFARTPDISRIHSNRLENDTAFERPAKVDSSVVNTPVAVVRPSLSQGGADFNISVEKMKGELEEEVEKGIKDRVVEDEEEQSSEWEDYGYLLNDHHETTETAKQVSLSSDEDSFIHVGRKKKARVLTDTPNLTQVKKDSRMSSPGLQPLKARVSKRTLAISSDDDSPVKMPVKKKCSIGKPFSAYAEDAEEEEDFADFRKPERKSSSDSDWMSKQNKNQARHTKKPKRTLAHGFIEDEAERSGDEDDHIGDDSYNTDLDRYDDSFVCDATQANSQAVAPEDMYGVYLRSLADEEKEVNHPFKLRDDHGDFDVFSQMPEEEASYEEDSFCVGDDFCDTEVPDHRNEVTMCNASLLEAPMQRRTRYGRKKEQIARYNQLSKANSKTVDGRRRIKKVSTSSSEDEAIIAETTTISKAKKATVRFSSSEEENTAEKHARFSDNTNSETSNKFRNTENTMPTQKKTFTMSKYEGAKQSSNNNDSPFSQLPSLQSRVKSRLREESTLSENREPQFKLPKPVYKSPKPAYISPKRNTTLKSPKETVVSTSDNLDEPVFSLGLDFEDSFGVGADDSIVAGFPEQVDSFSSSRIGAKDNSSVFKDPNDHVSGLRSPSSSTTGPQKVSPPVLSKEERLRICRLKQEEFKQKLRQDQKKTDRRQSLSIESFPSPTPGPIQPDLTVIEEDSTFNETLAPAPKGHPDGPVVFIDSREISGAQDVVSALRFKHKLQTSVRQLSCCDYVLSNRMAVERKALSDFTNGSNRAKLQERMCHMSELYDRPCVIIEKDRVKPGEKDFEKNLFKSKYVESTVAWLSQTAIRLYYSNSQEESAFLLSKLASLEKSKKFHITVPVKLTPQPEQMLSFYLSLPRVSFVAALNLLHGYKTVGDFINSTPSVIEEKGKLSGSKALEVYKYMKHKFDLQMIGHLH